MCQKGCLLERTIMWFLEPSPRTYCLCLHLPGCHQSTGSLTQVRRTPCHRLALPLLVTKVTLIPFPWLKSFSTVPLLHFPKLLAIPPPPHSPLSHLDCCSPFSPFMLLTLLHDVVFLAWKGQRARLTEMLNTWLPHGLLIFPHTASLAVFLFLLQLEI